MSSISVVAFVDWNSQIRNSGAKGLSSPRKRAEVTIKKTANAIAQALRRVDQRSRFDVQLRLYHGWHRGLTPTENRQGLRELENDPDFEFISPFGVRFLLPLEFGDSLLNALPHRRRPTNPKVHLPDTLRAPIEPSEKEREKMVDTALACDLLTHARIDPKDWRLVLAEDDDLVPALFVAESWTKDKGGKTILVRKRENCKHLLLDGLISDYTNDF